eukprot:gb/GECG01011675.1/.p1 GENE.gb/GECG01011675.1/~~gb/GECG01011675.1/.p1  ORF type:complete len:685 (+),score=124.48 gb/GECG01011675.1/:1-2055(+)
MSSDFPKLEIKRFPQLEERETEEARFWKRFRRPVTISQIGAVNHLCFNPVAPHDLAVTTSARIVVYNGQNLAPKHTFSRFKDIARSGEFRPRDGKLLVGGSDSGPIHLHNASTKAMLRVFRGHKGPVYATKFSGRTNIISGGDDATVKVWDVSSESPVTSLDNKHTDYVRAIACSDVSSSIFASGSYDHTVKLWDSRVQQSGSGSHPTMELDHGAPVSALMMLRGNGTLVSAGSNYLKVWDIVSGGKLLTTLSNHQKQITTLCLDGTQERLLSGGLDGHIKFYDLNTYEVAYGFKHSSPILSAAVNADNTRLAIGTTDKTVTVKQRIVPSKQVAAEKRQADVIRGGSYKYFMRGQSRTPSTSDIVAETDKAPKLNKYEKYLKKFQYNEALTATLSTFNPIIILSMLEELTRRGGLRAAIANRDETNLEPLVSFVVRYITHPRYSSVLLDVANMILDIYAPVMGQSYTIDHWFVKLQHKLREELKVQHQLFHLQGALDAIVAASTSNPYYDSNENNQSQEGNLLEDEDQDQSTQSQNDREVRVDEATEHEEDFSPEAMDSVGAEKKEEENVSEEEVASSRDEQLAGQHNQVDENIQEEQNAMIPENSADKMEGSVEKTPQTGRKRKKKRSAGESSEVDNSTANGHFVTPSKLAETNPSTAKAPKTKPSTKKKRKKHKKSSPASTT